MILSFHGGARTVTGANYLLDTGTKKILVDCGLFQGCRFCEERNRDSFPYDPREIDAVVLTHAHIDHSGRLPKLLKEGFQGKIFSTPPTRDLAELMLHDSADVMRHEIKDVGGGTLFEEKDVGRTINAFEGVEYGEEVDLGRGNKLVLRDAGHILGSSIVEIISGGKNVIFSGDLGNPPTPFLRPTEFVEKADWVVLESTYGDRIHEDKTVRKQIFEDVIEETIANGGVLMVPAFALERTQELLYELNELVENRRIPRVPIFIDSPLAIRATEVYKKYQERYFNKEASRLIASGDELFHFPGLTFTKAVRESKAINDVPSPKIIIAGSGMSNGGRILHHERRYLSDPKSTILFIGYQAAGTLGRRIFDGEKEVTIFREQIPVRSRVKAIGGYSAHADQGTLIAWITSIQKPIKKVFAVQGEEGPALALVQKIRDTLGVDADAPMLGDNINL